MDVPDVNQYGEIVPGRFTTYELEDYLMRLKGPLKSNPNVPNYYGPDKVPPFLNKAQKDFMNKVSIKKDIDAQFRKLEREQAKLLKDIQKRSRERKQAESVHKKINDAQQLKEDKENYIYAYFQTHGELYDGTQEAFTLYNKYSNRFNVSKKKAVAEINTIRPLEKLPLDSEEEESESESEEETDEEYGGPPKKRQNRGGAAAAAAASSSSYRRRSNSSDKTVPERKGGGRKTSAGKAGGGKKPKQKMGGGRPQGIIAKSSKGKCNRDMSCVFEDGEEIKHTDKSTGNTWIGRYSRAEDAIVHNGKKFNTPTAFCLAHLRVNKPSTPSCPGWDKCYIGENKSIFDLPCRHCPGKFD